LASVCCGEDVAVRFCASLPRMVASTWWTTVVLPALPILVRILRSCVSGDWCWHSTSAPCTFSAVAGGGLGGYLHSLFLRTSTADAVLPAGLRLRLRLAGSLWMTWCSASTGTSSTLSRPCALPCSRRRNQAEERTSIGGMFRETPWAKLARRDAWLPRIREAGSRISSGVNLVFGHGCVCMFFSGRCWLPWRGWRISWVGSGHAAACRCPDQGRLAQSCWRGGAKQRCGRRCWGRLRFSFGRSSGWRW